jgi:hypothetical protein
VELLPDSLSVSDGSAAAEDWGQPAYLLHVVELVEPTLITVMMSRLVEELNRELTRSG